MKQCRLFNCDKKHGNFCCADCEIKKQCKNPCLNSPQKCGYIKDLSAIHEVYEGVRN